MPRRASSSQSPPLKPSDPISTASLFTPRAFPPPSLAGVPVEYIIEQLHNHAAEFWDKPETADCTLVIPVPHPPGKTFTAFSPATEPGISRRVTEPALNAVPKISLKLHIDYLCAQSTFLRSLFSGASSLDLISTAALTQAPQTQPNPSGQFAVPPNRLPRLMPCSPDHPILFLPIPDPTSVHLLIHWMYFGSTAFIEDSLNDGSVEWEGIARNAEYLGLPADLKVFLGTWYTNWVRARGVAEEEEEDDDEDDASDAETVYYSDDEADDAAPSAKKLDFAANDDNLSDNADASPKRGRARMRPLSVASAHSV